MLSEEQLEEIRQFFSGEAAKQLFTQMEADLSQDWATTTDQASREDLWQQSRALRALHANLRDATAMKRLTQRVQERRATYTS